MDSLVGYGSDDDNEPERYESHHQQPASVCGSSMSRRRDDDGTNYDAVNMDMSEDSESEPELPPAEPLRHAQRERRSSDSRSESQNTDSSNDARRRADRQDDKERRVRPDGRDRRDRNDDNRRDRPDEKRRERYEPRERQTEREKPKERDSRPDERYNRSERDRNRRQDNSRRGILGDRPDRGEKTTSSTESKPLGGEPPSDSRSQDARDAISPRFQDRDRRERDRERERDRDRHPRRSEEKRSGRERYSDHRSRSRERNNTRISPPTEYRSTSYKVNRKLEVMEKMGLQIKTPDGCMATAQQLRQAASEAPASSSGGLPSYFNHGALSATKILDQVNKRKLLWSNKNKSEEQEAAKWSGTRFAQDNDGKQASKFMRLMGIKKPVELKQEEPDKTVDPIKKQEELFQAMQAQYEVARATTHTMRGVGLGFQRGQI